MRSYWSIGVCKGGRVVRHITDKFDTRQAANEDGSPSKEPANDSI